MKLDNAQAPENRYWMKLDPEAGEGDEGGAGGDGGGSDGGTLLTDGGDNGGAGGGDFTIPEKFLVNGQDGTPDYKATIAKISGSYGELEKRIGAFGLPPKDASEYKIENYLPDGVERDSAGEAEVLKEFHALGLSNKQAQGIMGVLGKTIAGGITHNEQTKAAGAAALKAEWGDKYDENMSKAKQFVSLVASDTEKAALADPKRGLGNDPVVLSILARAMEQLGEDKLPSMNPAEAENIDALIANPAYRDEKHPDHKSIVARVTAAYAKGYKHQK